MPLQATSGAASYDAFGGGAVAGPTYIEDVFSTWLYTGTGATQTITNGVDLAGKGGLVWIKNRSTATTDHFLFDTNRGALNEINTNSTAAQASLANSLTSFNANGFSIGSASGVNTNAGNYVSWTFRQQPKFFDVVTYTGNGSNRTIAHSLNSAVGMIIVKRTDTTSNWPMWHKSVFAGSNNQYLTFQSQANPTTDSTVWTTTAPTSTVFSVGTSALTNASGGTYVAYVFADSNAGGFGLLGTDSVIACGAIDGSSTDVYVSANLGWEPELILFKQYSGTGGPAPWILVDNKRRLLGTVTNVESFNLNPSGSYIDEGVYGLSINPTGFTIQSGSGSFGTFSSYVYMAIRRPMKVPTSGTSVFEPVVRAGTSANATVSTSFPVDMTMIRTRTGGGTFNTYDRLRAVSAGGSLNIRTGASNAEYDGTNTVLGFDTPNGVRLGADADLSWVNVSGQNYVNYLFRRASGFMDVVCYKGAGSAMTINHNLGVTPEMAIIKNRSSAENWVAWHKSFSPASSISQSFNGARSTGFIGTRTATTFAFSSGNALTSAAGNNYVAYFFATLAGVSKVGTYTGTGTTLQIDCGFTAGARFVLIARADVGTGGPGGPYYVWDTARGISSGNDPFMTLGQFGNEDTSTDYIDPFSAGFEISSSAPADINASGVPYIFLAIA